MTLDDTTLGTALRDLAATAPDNPARLSQVHRLARRRHHRQRALGAGALAATIAAGVAGVDALSSGGGGAAAGIRPASGGSAATAPAPTSGVTPGGLPACPANPSQAADKPAALPSVGQVVTGGGTITAPPTPSSIAFHVDGGPLKGADITLTVGPATKIYLDDAVVTGAQLAKGTAAKFSATMVAPGSYLLDELRAGSPSAGRAGTPSAPGTTSGPGTPAGAAAAAAKQAAAAAAAPPTVGGAFKVVGTVTAATATTITVDVTGGSLPPGPVTVTLTCAPAGPLTGHVVSIAGMRTATGYEAAALEVMAS